MPTNAKRSRNIVLALLLVLLSLGTSPADEHAAFNHGSWPFRPPQRTPVPTTSTTAWGENAIDAFVFEKLAAAGLEPSPEPDKRTLLRRVSFDLTGLPPTTDEQAAFLADERIDAYERLVDRLLASPAFGERWAQHWLDLVRYAETDGFKADEHRPNAYKYRDFVVRALNDDMPYDRFVAWQLAGDELEPENPLALIATGYNRLYPDEYNAANLEQRRQEILDDVTGTTGVALLGMTMGCAQCHDHKFDEILQTDYFRLQAFFTPLVPRDDVYDAAPADVERYQQKLAAWEEATREPREQIDALLGPKRAELREYALGKFRTEIREAVALPPEQRTPHQEQIARMAMRQAQVKEADAAKKLTAEDKQRYDDLQKKLAEFDHLRPPPLPQVMAVGDVGRTAPVTFLLDGGNWAKPSDEITPGFPEFLGEPSAEIQSPVSGAASTGRRSALARWITRPDHPLTARVMVNRLWQHHFGVGIVPTANDFGMQGESPTHRELLDWLAVELVDHGWSLKHLHRLMVTSAAYRQTSRVDAASPNAVRAREADPQNHLLWHARRRRLEGEAVRDAMLQIAGRLNSQAYGPSIRPELPEGISKNYAWRPDEHAADRCRRSIYVLAKRNLRYPLFEAFDLPDMHHSCPRRAVTTTAPQSLLLLNGELALEESRQWAGKLRQASGGDDVTIITSAYREAFGRLPQADEVETALQFLRKQAPAEGETLVDFCHALLNANEFLYVD